MIENSGGQLKDTLVQKWEQFLHHVRANSSVMYIITIVLCVEFSYYDLSLVKMDITIDISGTNKNTSQ